MDILCIIGRDNRDALRFSLRSIERYGKNVGRVYVVGDCPDWLSDNVIKIPFEQPYDYLPLEWNIRKMANITASLIYAVENSDIEEEFLAILDDEFYVRNVDFDNYPYYRKKIELPKVGNKILSFTRGILEGQKLSTHFFTLHRTMHMCKRDILDCKELFEIAIYEPLPLEPFTYLLNYRFSIYKDFTPVSTTDSNIENIHETNLLNTDAFSAFKYEERKDLAAFVAQRFKGKSIYEK